MMMMKNAIREGPAIEKLLTTLNSSITPIKLKLAIISIKLKHYTNNGEEQIFKTQDGTAVKVKP